MLFIFRQLRRLELRQRSGRYFLYAIGEIVLIMVGILLALQVNAWWDNRMAREEEQDILLALQDEFLANKNELNHILNVFDVKESHFARLQKLSEDQILTLNNQEIDQLMVSLTSRRTFDPIRGTVDALISAGRLDLIRNLELQRAITSFQRTFEEAEEETAYIQDFYLKLKYAMIRHGGPWANIYHSGRPTGTESFLKQATAQTLISIRADEELMGFARMERAEAYLYAGELSEVMNDIDRILELVSQELETHR